MSFVSRRTLAAAGAVTLFPLVLAACSSDGEEGPTDANSNGSETSASGKFDGQEIVLASVPSEDSTTIQSGYENIIKLLEKELGVKVKYQDATDYAAVIEGQRAGQIDMAAYGPFSYVIASDSDVPVDPVGTLANAKDEKPSYTSRLHVKKGSDIKNIEDVKGKKVCFVDQASTSGYLVPSYGLKKAGIDPEKDVTPVMAGAHDASLLSLDSGNCDAAFAFDAQQSKLEESGQLEKDHIEMIWESDPIPNAPLTVNTDSVDEDLAKAISDVLTEKGNVPALVDEGICSSEDDCTMPEDSEYGFIATDDKAYDVIRDICDVTKAEACKQVG